MTYWDNRMPLMVTVGDMVWVKDGIEDYKQRFAGGK